MVWLGAAVVKFHIRCLPAAHFCHRNLRSFFMRNIARTIFLVVQIIAICQSRSRNSGKGSNKKNSGGFLNIQFYGVYS